MRCDKSCPGNLFMYETPGRPVTGGPSQTQGRASGLFRCPLGSLVVVSRKYPPIWDRAVFKWFRIPRSKNLSGRNFDGVNFYGVDLSYGDLRDAKLRSADLWNSNLVYAMGNSN